MIFVDTPFWVALRNRRDDHHAEATELLTDHADESLVTTNHVLGETWTFLRRRAGHASAVAFLEALASSPRAEVHAVDGEVEDDAWQWLRRHDEQPYSFVDATSFAVMRRLDLRRALTFDDDFRAAGFDVVRIR